MKTLCDKLTSLLDTIKTKRRIRQGYISLPSTDTLPPTLPLLPDFPAIDLLSFMSSSFSESTPTTTTTATARSAIPWTDFQPLVNLIQQPVNHSAWKERPFVRGAPSGLSPGGRRWSHPAYVHSAGAQAQLLAALHIQFYQGRCIEGLEEQLADRERTIIERDSWVAVQDKAIEELQRMMLEEDEMIREKNATIAELQQSSQQPEGRGMMRYLRAVHSLRAARREIADLHQRLAETEQTVAKKTAQIDQLRTMLETCFDIIHRYYEHRRQAELSESMEVHGHRDSVQDGEDGGESGDVSLRAEAWFVEAAALMERAVQRL